jgi:hypothetical protein
VSLSQSEGRGKRRRDERVVISWMQFAIDDDVYEFRRRQLRRGDGAVTQGDEESSDRKKKLGSREARGRRESRRRASRERVHAVFAGGEEAQGFA